MHSFAVCERRSNTDESISRYFIDLKNSLASLLLYKELYVNNLLKYTLESTLVFINNPAHRHDCIWYTKIQITPNHNRILPTWLNNATIVPANKDNLCLMKPRLAEQRRLTSFLSHSQRFSIFLLSSKHIRVHVLQLGVMKYLYVYPWKQQVPELCLKRL